MRPPGGPHPPDSGGPGIWPNAVHRRAGIDRLFPCVEACRGATAGAEAREARARLGIRPEQREVLGLCLARSADGPASVRELESAVSRDPRNWEIRYELGLVRGMAGEDPRPTVRAARRLNTYEPLAINAVKALRKAPARPRAETGRGSTSRLSRIAACRRQA